MLLGEPPRSQGDLSFSLLGIPVRVHPLFWLVAVLLAARSVFHAPDLRSAVMILLPWVTAVFIAILFHEMGHAMVMRAYGFRPWITLYGFGGLASYNPAQSYRSKGFGTWGQIAISAAGPGAGFVLAAVVMAVLKLAGYKIAFGLGGAFGIWVDLVEQVGSPILTDFIRDLLYISIIWGMINLLPIYPLDGGQISREILLETNPRGGIQQSLMLSMVTALVVALLGLVRLGDLFIALLFGYLAYLNYQALQAYTGRRGPW